MEKRVYSYGSFRERAVCCIHAVEDMAHNDRGGPPVYVKPVRPVGSTHASQAVNPLGVGNDPGPRIRRTHRNVASLWAVRRDSGVTGNAKPPETGVFPNR